MQAAKMRSEKTGNFWLFFTSGKDFFPCLLRKTGYVMIKQGNKNISVAALMEFHMYLT